MLHDTICLLKECNSGCKSATNSMEQVLPYVKDEKLSDLIHKYNAKHVDLGDSCHKMLNELGKDEEDPKPVSRAMAWLGTEMKLTMNDDTKTIVGMMMDGCNMGIKSLSGYMNEYSEASAESRALTKRLVKLEEDFHEELRAFI